MNKRAAIALGRIAATERIVGALIATHPNPKVLHELWNRFEEVLRAAVTAQATIESSAAKHPH